MEPVAQLEPDAPAPPRARWMRWARAIAGLLAFVALIAVLSRVLHGPLERMGTRFVARFGYAGMALGTFLADGLHVPVPPQFYMLASVTAKRPALATLVAITAGSLVAAFVAYALGRTLGHVWPLRRVIARSRHKIDQLFVKYGAWAIAVGSLTPLPFSLLCNLSGSYRVKPRYFALVMLFRVPRLVLFYALIRLGWA